MATGEVDLARWTRARVRLIVGATVVGGLAGVAATVALALYGGGVGFGTRKAFALGALALGFGVLGWSGSVMAGRGVENLQQHLDRPSDWTEADSRRAMARIGGFGGGMMVGVSFVEAIL